MLPSMRTSCYSPSLRSSTAISSTPKASLSTRAFALVRATRRKCGATLRFVFAGVASVGRVEAQFLMVCFLNPPV